MKKDWKVPKIIILNVSETSGGSNKHTEYVKPNGKLSNGTAAS